MSRSIGQFSCNTRWLSIAGREEERQMAGALLGIVHIFHWMPILIPGYLSTKLYFVYPSCQRLKLRMPAL